MGAQIWMQLRPRLCGRTRLFDVLDHYGSRECRPVFAAGARDPMTASFPPRGHLIIPDSRAEWRSAHTMVPWADVRSDDSEAVHSCSRAVREHLASLSGTSPQRSLERCRQWDLTGGMPRQCMGGTPHLACLPSSLRDESCRAPYTSDPSAPLSTAGAWTRNPPDNRRAAG